MNQIAIHTRLPLPADANVSPQQWRVLTEAIFPAAKSPEAICLALDYCRARKLDVFKRPVHIVPMWNSSLRREVETVWPGINELQVTAARTSRWAGMDAPKWGPDIKAAFSGRVGRRGEERQVSIEVTYPEWCSVTVYRIVDGTRCAFTEPVYWIEAYARQGRSTVPNEMWQKRTRGQLHKVAKAASLRAAFPEEMGNDYAAEEMEGAEIEAGGVIVDGAITAIDGQEADYEETAEPDVRDALNDAIPLTKPVPLNKAAAAEMPRAPKVIEKPRTPREFLASLAIALRDAKSAEEADKIVCSEDVLRAKGAFNGEAKVQLDKLITDAMKIWFSEPPSEKPEAEEPADELLIHGEEKLASG